MKLLKVLLSSMFVFTAVIRSAQVGQCGSINRRYTGIQAQFYIKNHAGVIVSQSMQCGTNWPEIKDGIKTQLREMQEQVNEDQMELRELKRLKTVAHEITSVEITGD